MREEAALSARTELVDRSAWSHGRPGEEEGEWGRYRGGGGAPEGGRRERRGLGTASLPGLGPSWVQKRLVSMQWETTVRRGPRGEGEDGSTRSVKPRKEPWSGTVNEC